MPNPSSLVAALPASGIRKMMAKASALGDVARLDIGEPQFTTPPHITEAAFAAAKAGATKYTASAGLASTRQAIAESVTRNTGRATTADNVIVTVGAVGAIVSAVRTVVEGGDDVLIPDPAWPNYTSIVKVSGAEPRPYALAAEDGFLPTREVLDAAVTPRTKAILVNTPGNPTGAVYSRSQVEEVLRFAREHDLFVISDEVYSRLVFEPPFTSVWGLGEDDRVIVADSFSKTYSMTGWRIGWALAVPATAQLIGKLQEAYVSCCSMISQKAAEAALSGDQECVATALDAYRRNVAVATAELDAHGIGYTRPAGSFYLWVDAGCDDSWSFAERLLDERHVAVAPGEAFGAQGRGRVRLSLASSEDQVRRGVHELASACDELRGATIPG